MTDTNTKLLFLDTETGGKDPKKHSLLSVGMVVWQKNEGILAQREWLIKSENYIYTNEASKINHFIPELHNSRALDSTIVLEEIIAFCREHFVHNVSLAGHNVHFDFAFIKKLFQDNGRSVEKLFSHRLVDTYAIMKYLFLAGVLKKEITSSDKAFKYFGIKVDNRHTALGDAIATLKLFEALIGLLPE